MLRLSDEAEHWVCLHAFEAALDDVMEWIAGTLCESANPLDYAEPVTSPAPPFSFVPGTNIAVTFTISPREQCIDIERIETVEEQLVRLRAAESASSGQSDP